MPETGLTINLHSRQEEMAIKTLAVAAQEVLLQCHHMIGWT